MQNVPENEHFLPPVRTHTCAYQGLNVSFSDNFAEILNGCSLTLKNSKLQKLNLFFNFFKVFLKL